MSGYSSDSEESLWRLKQWKGVDDEFQIQLKCGKKNVSFLVDTGADVSVILTVKIAERAGGEIVEITRLFTRADGSMLQAVGKMRRAD